MYRLEIATAYRLSMVLLVLSSSTSLQADLIHEDEIITVAETGTTPGSDIARCAGILFGGSDTGSGEGDSEPSVARLSQSGWTKKIISQDPSFVKLVYAVIYVESRFNPTARSHKDAYGLMQMTEPAVIDAAKHCSLRPIPDMDHLFDVKTNIQYGSCYLRKLLDETDGDTVRALVAYNGGYKALTVYDREGNLNQETANYVLKVNQALKKCTVPSNNTYAQEK